MADRPGHVWQVIQEWLDTFRYRPPSQNELAPRFGVSPSSLSEYKYARTMPSPEFVVRAAAEMGVPYARLLDAVLEDHGYLGESLQEVRSRVARGTLGGNMMELPTERRAAIDRVNAERRRDEAHESTADNQAEERARREIEQDPDYQQHERETSQAATRRRRDQRQPSTATDDGEQADTAG